MITTTSYGSWARYTSGLAMTPRDMVGEVLSEMPDPIIDLVTKAYRDRINAALPDSVSLCGDEFYGPAYEADKDFEGYPLTGDGTLDIAAIIDNVDFWIIPQELEE